MANFTKIKTIITHEYLIKVKTKGFIIGTFLGPLLMVLAMAIPGVVMYFSMNSTSQRLAVMDKTGEYGNRLVKQNPDLYYLTNADEAKLSDSVRSENLDGYLVIDSNLIASGTVSTFSKGASGLSLSEKLSKHLSKIRENELLKTAGIDNNTYNNISKDVDIKQIKLSDDKAKKNEESNTEFHAIFAYIAGFFIYFMLLMYGSTVMRGVIEEKANRIVEVLASSAKPFEIMFGKVVGIGLVGLTQMLFWILMGAGLMALAGPIIGMFAGNEAMTQQVANMQSMGGASGMPQITEGFTIPSISLWVVFSILFFFIVGYFMYSTLYAAVGSAVDQEADAGQLATPITLLVVIPFLMISTVMTDPNSTVATITSMIPFFSPMLMLARIIVTDGQLPLWQVLTSMVLCIATFLGCLWVAARIYRVGILMYGKKPKITDLWKWLKQAN